MKLIASILLILSLATLASAQAPNPFTPKTKTTAAEPTHVRAIVAKMHTVVTLPCIVQTSQGCADKTLDANHGYRVVIGNDLYWTSGVGPSSGIYDAEIHENYIHINIPHMNVKPDETYHLSIELIQHDQAESRIAPTKLQPETVDGRRLIIYARSTDSHGNTKYTAVTQATATAPETHFIFSAYKTLPLGIYDFQLAAVEKQQYLDLLTNPKGFGPMWIRFGLDAQVLSKQ